MLHVIVQAAAAAGSLMKCDIRTQHNISIRKWQISMLEHMTTSKSTRLPSTTSLFKSITLVRPISLWYGRRARASCALCGPDAWFTGAVPYVIDVTLEQLERAPVTSRAP